MQKAKDLMVYLLDAGKGYQIPERYLTLTDVVKRRYGITVRQADMKHLEAEVVTITNLANTSICDNWGFYPVTDAEARAMARDLKQILDPRGALIAEDSQGKAIGFALSLPDINVLLKGLDGRMSLRLIYRMLFKLPHLHQYRMWALGVLPEYQVKG
jgi:hypothetical protein